MKTESKIRNIKYFNDLLVYFSEELKWDIDIDDFDDIDDITYEFTADDLCLKEEVFEKISSLRQLKNLSSNQSLGIFCVEYNSKHFEITALRKILWGLVDNRRNSNHAVWKQRDLLFICFWGTDANRTIGIAHFEDKETGLPQIKVTYCSPAKDDITKLSDFKKALSFLEWQSDMSHGSYWKKWSKAFPTGYRENIRNSSTLTLKLAESARNIRNQILETLEVESDTGDVYKIYNRFKETLIHDMTKEQFADMYAQTVVYGLFSARCMDETPEDFSVSEAISCIPNTNPFLRDLLEDCIGSKNKHLLFDELEIGNVLEILRHTDISSIIKDFNRQTGNEDPVIHFYEEFLSAYDKDVKKNLGVFYTPQPVVNFMVRSVDSILKEEFGLIDGLASSETKRIKETVWNRKKNGETEIKADVPKIQILDPSTGTGTFLRQIILQIYENFKNNHSGDEYFSDEWSTYVRKNLLPRLNGFELMMAPYAVAHMKLAMVLKETGYDFRENKRLKLYLTNTLEEAGWTGQSTFDSDQLGRESAEANGVKINNGINIIIGNPPYKAESSNKGDWILNLLDDYKKEPNSSDKLNERNPKWINDDYIKFIRVGQDYIERATNGILAFICPHGFIDNPTFRGMRWNLLKSFNKMYILDLHGNTKKSEKCPDGSKDQNVFAIEQGVCIFIAIKKDKTSGNKLGEVYHSDLYGLRDKKFQELNKNGLSDVKFEKVNLVSPQYFFVPKDLTTGSEYLGTEFFGIDELMNKNSVGFVSSRDDFCIQNTYDEMSNVISDFSKLDIEVARNKYNLRKDVRDWQVKWAQDDIRKDKEGNLDYKYIREISYRPFDDRYTYYTDKSKGFLCYPRYDVLQNMLSCNNLSLCLNKVIKSGDTFQHCFVSDKPIDSCFVSNKTSEITYAFPLFVSSDGVKKSNLNKEIVSKFSKNINKLYNENPDESILNPYNVFYYIYGCLYSKEYRDKYIVFLKIGFPRIRYPINEKEFMDISEIGEKLVNLHLMKESFVCSDLSSDKVIKIDKIDYKSGRVYVNKQDYFEVNIDDWNFKIGSYQVLENWLKGKKGHELSTKDIMKYKQIISIISETRKLMDELP